MSPALHRRSNWPFARSVIAAMIFIAGYQFAVAADNPQPLTSQQRQSLEEGQRTLKSAARLLLNTFKGSDTSNLADVGIYQKGLEWALRYDREFSQSDVQLLQNAISRGTNRAEILAKSSHLSGDYRGKVALGYYSRIDNSVQPYGLIVPKSYDPTTPIRLDVVLHGSTRPVGMSELRFISRFEDAEPKETVPDQPFIELHPLGRVENCYRWAGETDVFEAIEDVCRRYNIDRDRIVLRGMSMGASGTWHLGLKHPDTFVALGPYCGYVDTHRFSETPLPNFVKVGPLPEYQELGLHMLDSVDYAANAGVVPVVACMGENDIFFQAHVLMGEAMRKEGLNLVNLISPGTGHVIDPVTHTEQMRRIGEFAARGLNHIPQEIRFVSWTLKYNRCHWLQVLALQKHYERSELKARLNGDIVEVDEPQNVMRFAILTSQLPSIPKKLRIGGLELAIPNSITAVSKGAVASRSNQMWHIDGEVDGKSWSGKRPGLQGPIDDAFTSPFVCVRGTGQPWNAQVQAYAEASLKRFAEEWHHYFRGELPIKDDTAVTDDDVQSKNLILFGDPGSNSWIAKVIPHLMTQWTNETLKAVIDDGDGREVRGFPAANHVPVLITVNPLPNAGDHYVVINSGHTFRESELSKVNYLLFPRLGDWAVIKIEPNPSQPLPFTETVLHAGYFDEFWMGPRR